MVGISINHKEIWIGDQGVRIDFCWNRDILLFALIKLEQLLLLTVKLYTSSVLSFVYQHEANFLAGRKSRYKLDKWLELASIKNKCGLKIRESE